eukprot:TRINITY_DN2244_c0_g2_i1.p1 TRINITY_DN2244_c0_g2~~TRINITY_DN2244_c0_g2_i1.p1  ORF type:complete len:342 (+),score=37.38 TRINITY_DN2244_c0_g2_i1:89-1114(+)
MTTSTVSAASWASTPSHAVYLDEHGFIMNNNNQTQTAPLTQRQSDRDNKKLDKWMKMIAKWDETEKDYQKLKRRIRAGGIPQTLRGLVWQLMLGSRQKQMANASLYTELCRRNMDSGLAEIIKRDLGRTFPTHALFLGTDSVGQKSLYSLLKAYAIYDPKIGYCQGMGFIAATLLTQMKEEEAFWCFVLLMKRQKYELGDMYLPGFPKVQEAFEILQILIEAFSPPLAEHFRAEGINTNYFASQWFMTLFVYLFPFKLLLRVWDIFLLEGWKLVFRVAMSLLLSAETELLELKMEGILPKLKTLHENKDPSVLIAEACKIKITNRELRLLAKRIRENSDNA